MRRRRILSVNNPRRGISEGSDPAGLPTKATAYTVERDKNGRARKVHPPAVTFIDEVVPGPAGGCPECGMTPGGKPLREGEDKRHKLYHCEGCGTDFAVTDGLGS